MQGDVDIVQAGEVGCSIGHACKIVQVGQVGEVGCSIGHACKERLTLYRQVRWDAL